MTTSAGTSSGKSWIWPSVAGECGWRRALCVSAGQMGLGCPAWGVWGGLTQAERAEERDGISSERERQVGHWDVRLREVTTLFVNIKG